tara:strand:- start:2335 stop:2493 length:159 start_codon:yes stop_codon:yes gene_type:complete
MLNKLKYYIIKLFIGQRAAVTFAINMQIKAIHSKNTKLGNYQEWWYWHDKIK